MELDAHLDLKGVIRSLQMNIDLSIDRPRTVDRVGESIVPGCILMVRRE